MKNKYLTDLALQKRVWHIPAGLFSAMFAAVAVEVWIEDAPGHEGTAIWILAHLTVLALTLVPLYRILRWRIRQRRAKKVAERLARRDETTIPLHKLDGILGMRNADAKVADLMKSGFLQRIELEDGNLVLDHPEIPEPEPEPAPETPDDVIRQIRYLNDEIDDEAVSRRIDRIEAVTASILRTLRERPDCADEARRFMSYYLPTTLKLLESYRLMEKQSYQGENIQAARGRIEAVLDKLVAGAEAQQDKLFGAEALDVEAEISVLEAMMTSDGLIQKGDGQKN